jgi:hypothetical protein
MTNTTTNLSEETKHSENSQDSESSSYATRLAHGQVTHNAANEIDQEVSQTQNRSGDGGKRSGTSENQGQGSSDHSGESTSGSLLNFSSLAPNESSASSFMGNDSGTFAGHSDEDLGPEHIMHMLSQTAQSSQENWNNLGNSATGAGLTGQMENQTSATPGAQDNPNQSPSLIASLNPTQLANDGIADYSQGLQMLMQDSSNNPAAAQNDVLLAQTGLAMADLGLDLYQLDSVSGSGAGATTLPGGDSSTTTTTGGGGSGTTTTTGSDSGTTTTTGSDSGTTTSTGGVSGSTTTTGGDSGTTTNPITSLQGSDPTLAQSLTDASTQVTNGNLTAAGFSQFENNVQALQQGAPNDGSQYPDDASLLKAALQPQQGQQALSAGDMATLQQVINNDATGTNDNYVSTYNPINDQNIQSMLIQGLAPDQGQDPLAGEVLTDEFNGGQVSAAGYVQFDQIVTQAETGVDGYGNDTDLLNGSLQQFQQQGGAASDANALQNVIIGDTGETSTGSTTSAGTPTGGEGDTSGSGSTTSGGSDTSGSSSTTSGGSDTTGSGSTTSGGSDTAGSGSTTSGGDGSAGSVLNDTNIYTTAQALDASVTQADINSLVNPNNNQVYLTADPNAVAGNGSSASQPLFAGTANTFDSIVNSDGANTTFHLAPGTYQTNGYNSENNPPGNVYANAQFIGSGMDNTTIQLAPTATVSQQGTLIFGNAFGADGSGFTVAGVTLDGNANNVTAMHENGGGAITNVGVQGNDITLYGDKVEGFASTYTNGREDFPVGLGPGPNATDGTASNDVVSHVIFTNPGSDDGTGNGTSILTLPPGNNLSTNNWFGGMTAGDAGSFNALDSVGDIMQYNYTDPTIPMSVYVEPENPNAETNATPGTALYDPSDSPTVIQNNDFQGGGVRYSFDSNAQQGGDVDILNNNFANSNPLPSPVTDGIVVADPLGDSQSPWFLGNFDVSGNTFAGSTLTDPTPSVFANGVTASGNTDEDGNPVTVSA